MSWLVTNRRSFLHEQAAMFVLMFVMTAVFTCQMLTPFEWQLPFMTIPADVAESWKLLCGGDVDLSILWSFVTLFTYSLLHADLEHLASNMLFYWIFGALINELLGWRWLIGIALITAVGGGITHAAMNPELWGPMIGASGVVSGFMGAYLGLSVRWHLPDPHIWPIARPIPPANLAILAVIFVAIDYRAIFTSEASMTAFGAHVGGFTTGLFLACFVTPKPRQAHHRG